MGRSREPRLCHSLAKRRRHRRAPGRSACARPAPSISPRRGRPRSSTTVRRRICRRRCGSGLRWRRGAGSCFFSGFTFPLASSEVETPCRSEGRLDFARRKRARGFHHGAATLAIRSEERREGKGGVRKGRYRESRYHEKKKNKKK